MYNKQLHILGYMVILAINALPLMLAGANPDRQLADARTSRIIEERSQSTQASKVFNNNLTPQTPIPPTVNTTPPSTFNTTPSTNYHHRHDYDYDQGPLIINNYYYPEDQYGPNDSYYQYQNDSGAYYFDDNGNPVYQGD